MAFNTGSRKKNAVLSDINITPMVDVMLVLLVIFIMAAPLMTQSAVKVKTADSKAASQQAKAPPVVLSVNSQGAYFLGTTPLRDEELLPTLKALAAKDPEAIILIRADKDTPYAKVAQLMQANQSAGLEKMTFDMRTIGK